MMKTYITRNDTRRTITLLLLGLLAAAILFLPYFYLGEDSVFKLGDGLDQDPPYFLLSAKYLFRPGKMVLDELFNGAPRGAIQTSSFVEIVLMRFLEPIWAYILHFFMMQLYGIAGMFLVLHSVLKKTLLNDLIALGLSICYILLPFGPTWGLSYIGVPMMYYCIIRLSFREYRCGNNFCTALLWGLFTLYCLASSVMYAGFYIVITIFVFLLLTLSERGRHILDRKNIIIQFVIICGLYFLEYFYTIHDVLTVVSHRTEFIKKAKPFWNNFYNNLVYGHVFTAPSVSRYVILPVAIVSAVILLLRRKDIKNEIIECGGRILLWCDLAIILICFFWSFYESEQGIRFFSKFGIIGTFGWDRVNTALPCLWMIAAAITLSIILEGMRLGFHAGSWMQYLTGAALTIALCGLAFLMNYDYVATVNRLPVPDVVRQERYLSWRDVYDEELFSRISSYIGRPQSEYRIACVGMPPAEAMMNGFYTLDGYSVNYPVEYKHAFRKVIAGELDKDPELQVYFDEYGARCYVFSAEIGKNYYIFDRDAQIQQLDIDMKAFAELDGEYILSALRIMNAESIGLELLEKFESNVNDRIIYLYVNSAF